MLELLVEVIVAVVVIVGSDGVVGVVCVGGLVGVVCVGSGDVGCVGYVDCDGGLV